LKHDEINKIIKKMEMIIWKILEIMLMTF
jgi:hypothetical protein